MLPRNIFQFLPIPSFVLSVSCYVMFLFVLFKCILNAWVQIYKNLKSVNSYPKFFLKFLKKHLRLASLTPKQYSPIPTKRAVLAKISAVLPENSASTADYCSSPHHTLQCTTQTCAIFPSIAKYLIEHTLQFLEK